MVEVVEKKRPKKNRSGVKNRKFQDKRGGGGFSWCETKKERDVPTMVRNH